MFDDLAAYYHENVVASYIAYRDLSSSGVAGCSRDLREALTAANALFHFREHLPDVAPTRRHIEQLCPDYALLGDVANASKHKSLTGNTPHGAPLVNDAGSLYERILLIEYEDDDGVYKYTAKTVVVNLIDGTERNLLEVLTKVINFWEQHLTLLGTLSEARVFRFESPVRARTRAECEENRLDFELVQGHRFRQSMQMLHFNNDTQQVEPKDLTGTEINFRIYKPKFDVDIFLTHDATGKEFKKSITLSESDSLELSRLTSDSEKQAYVNKLPEAQNALRLLAIEAGLEKE
jgi:hypothetical protein